MSDKRLTNSFKSYVGIDDEVKNNTGLKYQIRIYTMFNICLFIYSSN